MSSLPALRERGLALLLSPEAEPPNVGDLEARAAKAELTPRSMQGWEAHVSIKPETVGQRPITNMAGAGPPSRARPASWRRAPRPPAAKATA